MRGATVLVASVVLLAACGTIQSILRPPKQPVEPAPTSGLAGAPPTTPVPAAAPTLGPAPLSTLGPAPVPTSPAAAPSAPASPAALPPTTAPSSGAAPAAPSPPGGGVLTVRLSAEQERRLREDTQKKLDDAERLLQKLAGRPLKPTERETLVLAQSFVAEARKALGAQEYERAANLAAKAQTLSNDLVGTAR